MTLVQRYAKKYDVFAFDSPAERVLRMAIDNPGSLNSLDANGHRQMTEIWRDIDADDAISAVILTGKGSAFSAGGDFSIIEEFMENPQSRLAGWKEARDLVYNVINCGKPTVSAINGVCVGAGLVSALLCDISIAAKSAPIIDGHTRLGVAAGDHAAICWPLLCGMAKAKYYLLLCDRISGEEAERIGLVSQAVDDDQLQDRAVEVADRLARMAPAAVRLTKYSLNNWYRVMGPTFDASLAMEFLGFAGPEVAEGLAALKEKRPPAHDPDCPL